MEHTHEGSQCGGYRCASCGQASAEPFACPCGAGRADHVLIIPSEPAAEAAQGGAVVRDSLGRPTDHRTPCDEGKHGLCRDEGCDCNCHAMGWMTQVDQFLHQ